MNTIWLSATGLFGSTLLGALLGFFFKELPHKWNDTVLGYCSGIMLAASTLGLIVPAFEQGGTHHWWLIVVGVMGGALFLNVLDLVTPHLHHLTGLDPEQHSHNSNLNRIMLFVLAIALHKLPEGMAAGVSLTTAGDVEGSWLVSFGIALQNIPEGLVIIAPLLVAGVTPLRTLLIANLIALLEVMGMGIGLALGTLSQSLLPVLLGFAGGAMLYVTSDEMIPETHAHGYQKQATYALLLGFMTLVVMEKMLE